VNLRIGSRGSALALWQAEHVSCLLRAHGHEVSIEIIKTTGDRMQEPGFVAPAGVDGKGIFTKEIEEALAGGKVDLAVHSLKDLPTELNPAFELGAIPERADARDALICPEWLLMHTLPIGARVGTTSPRRRAQLLAHRPDFQFVPIRGNIDTRLRKLREGQCDALVLAAAGLDRLGPEKLNMPPDWVRQRFDPEDICPSPGQGALAIEIRSGDAAVRAAVRLLHCETTAWCVDAERAVLAALGGGCSVPIGAHCAGEGKFRRMLACVVAEDGDRMVQISRTPEEEDTPQSFGEFMAGELERRGANELLHPTV